MTALPPLYARYRPLFAKMDLPLRQALEGMLTAFAKRPPPMAAQDQQPEGEFTGFDGIENRGRLSNLLESEWLLRELDPDDFVRRVAESEVLYRRREFKGTGEKDVLAVVLDCGPWMLGRNRIVALAALFYLALRAERQGATLLWTVPGEAKGWSEDLTPETIRIFLGRVVQGSLPEARLTGALAQLEQGPEECWYVGARQSATLADHEAISGSILLHTPYAAETSEVQITSRGRRSTLALPLPDEPDTVAALRRPFLPERKTPATVAADKGLLTAQPYHRDWLLDRFNKAVVIRYPNGLLWQPLREDDAPVWLASRKDILGVQPKVDRQLSVLLADGDEVELVTVEALGQEPEVQQRQGGQLSTPGPIPTNAMGNLHLTDSHSCLLIAADGSIHQPSFDNYPTDAQPEARAVFSNGIYLITQSDRTLRVQNPKRGTLARVELPPQDAALADTPRRMVFSPDTKAITYTADGELYISVIGLDQHVFSLPDMDLLHFHSPDKALGWDRKKGWLVDFRLQGDEVRRIQEYSCPTPINGQPRYCPLSTTTFALNTDASGAPETFVPVRLPKGWHGVEPVNIPEAVEKAPTLWL